MINIITTSLIVSLLANLSAGSSNVEHRRASEEEDFLQGLGVIAGDGSRSSANACNIKDFQGRYYFSISGYCLKAEVFSGGELGIESGNLSCTEADASNSVQIISAFEDFAGNEATFVEGAYTYSGSIIFTGGEVTEVSATLRDLTGTVFLIEVQVPACIREAERVDNPCTEVFGDGVCQACTGDCDYDSDCAGDLKCFQRSYGETDLIAGCVYPEALDTLGNTDICFSPPDVEDGVIHYVGECGYYDNEVCGLCQGDCDEDSDCEEGLACIQREGFEEVLGCTGHGGIFDYSGNDVCSLDYCNINAVAGKTFFLEVAGNCLKIEFFAEGSISVDNQNTNCTMEGESNSTTAISFLEENLNNRAVYKGAYNGEIYITQDQSITEVMPLFQGFTGPNGGFVLQIVLPSCIQEIQYVANPCTDYFGAGNCHICTGDCDYDSDCAGDLKCFERSYDLEEVPGCNFTDFNDRDSDADYCFLPPNPAYGVIHYVGECGYYDNEVCGLCQGDCDEDSDCEEGLVCIERDGFEEVLGCTGQGGMYDYPTQDVCILDYCEINGELEGTYFLAVAGVCLKIEFFAEGTISVDNSNPSCTEAGASSSISIISTLDSFTNNGGALYKGTNSGEIYFTQDLSVTEVTPLFKGFTGPDGGFVLQIVVPYCPVSQGTVCQDVPGWVSSLGENCAVYEFFDWCSDYGTCCDNDKHVANTACCACGGGVHVVETCIDNPNFIDYNNRTCADYTNIGWYDDDVNHNTDEYDDYYNFCYDDAYQSGINGLLYATTECCACGGGTADTLSPTLSPAPSTTSGPTTELPLLEFVTDCVAEFGNGACPICTGDCDYDSDCAGDLRCFRQVQNLGDDCVPGCECPSDVVISIESTYGYCFSPPNVEEGMIHYVGECGGANELCGLCQGDCDKDTDCEEGLICYKDQRYLLGEVPGCFGHGEEYDVVDVDVCIVAPSSSPTIFYTYV